MNETPVLITKDEEVSDNVSLSDNNPNGAVTVKGEIVDDMELLVPIKVSQLDINDCTTTCDKYNPREHAVQSGHSRINNKFVCLKGQIYKCNACNGKYHNLYALREHILKAHNRHGGEFRKSFWCDTCDYACWEWWQLKLHVHSHRFEANVRSRDTESVAEKPSIQ